MVGKVSAAANAAGPTLRIAERHDDAQGAAVYDVYRGSRRVAWGLSDRAAAARWIQRLGDVVTGAQTEEPPAAPPRRTWWSERG